MVPFLFDGLVIIALLSAIMVVSAINPVSRIALLVVVFLIGSFIMMIMDFNFLGLTYIVVYVGAILILFLFVLMMVQIETSTPTVIRTVTVPTTSYTGGLGSNHMVGLPMDLKAPTECITLLVGLTGSFTDSNLVLDSNYAAELGVEPFEFHQRVLTPTGVGTPTGGRPSVNQMGHVLRGSTTWTKWIIGLFLICFGSIFFMGSFTHLFHLGSTGINTSALPTYLTTDCYAPFYPSWTNDFNYLTDIDVLSMVTFLIYPISLVLIGTLLFTVLIGIITITHAS